MGRLVPIAMFGILFIVFFSVPKGDWTLQRAIVAIFMFGLFGMVVWFQLSAVPSVVLDHGEHLAITVKGRTSNVPLSAISEVQYKPLMLGNLVTLYFLEPGSLGSAVSYVPVSGFRRRTQSDVDELRRRVVQARLSAAA